MLHTNTSTGLGFDFSLPRRVPVQAKMDSTAEDSINNSDNTQSARNRSEPSLGSTLGVMGFEHSFSNLQSTLGMKESLQGEAGDKLVETDVSRVSSAHRRDHRITPEFVNTEGSSGQANRSSASESLQQLSRHGTLLSVGATPDRKAAELKTILGSANSRLKPGAVILPGSGQLKNYEEPTSLEQAKSRTRVEVDIVLHSNICVQGECLQGYVTVNIRKRLKNESVVAISGGKIRIIGFESISNERNRYPFYLCSSSLSAIAAPTSLFRKSKCDSEGFSQASEGRHRLPFSMYLPLSADHGTPKGAMHTQSGVAVRYIVMVSIKVKELESNKRSIAHFYRDCEIWPRLNPSVILAAAAQPLQMSVSRGLFRGGNGKVSMTASLHRLHWVAGQQCHVNMRVTNATKKTIKCVTLSLFRSTVVFKPDPSLEPFSEDYDLDLDACQTTTNRKQISESVLEMSQQNSRGHASAKGWWTGVGPGEQLDFSHVIAIPPDALSITRSRLLEVDYSLRITLSARTLKTADIQVTLPIRIINFLSIDPPSGLSPFQNDMPNNHNENMNSAEHGVAHQPHRDDLSRPKVSGLFEAYCTNPKLESSVEADEENSGTLNENPDDAYDGIDSEFYGDYYRDVNDIQQMTIPEDMEDFSIYEDDADEIEQYTYLPAAMDLENAPRFSDLYYASVQENLDQVCQEDNILSFDGKPEGKPTQPPTSSGLEDFNVPKHSTGACFELRPNARRPANYPRPNRPRGPSSFARRVQEKINAVTTANDLGNLDHLEDISAIDRGSSQSHTIFDPDDGSYFSARDVPDQTVVQDMHGQHDLAGSVPETCLPITLDLCDTRQAQIILAASPMLDAVSRSTNNGSRLLPVPPVTNGDVLQDTTSKIVSRGPLPTCPATDINVHNTESAQSIQTLGESPATGTRSCAQRPSISMMAGAVSGSANSVRDRIKELEERVRAVEAGEV